MNLHKVRATSCGAWKGAAASIAVLQWQQLPAAGTPLDQLSRISPLWADDPQVSVYPHVKHPPPEGWQDTHLFLEEPRSRDQYTFQAWIDDVLNRGDRRDTFFQTRRPRPL